MASFLDTVGAGAGVVGNFFSNLLHGGGSQPSAQSKIINSPTTSTVPANTKFLPTVASVPAPTATPNSSYADAAYLASLQNSTDQQIAALQKQIRDLSNPQPAPVVQPPTLPDFSVNDTYDKARQIATSNVSPYYEKQLADFKTAQEAKRQRALQDQTTLQSNIDTELGNVQKANEINAQRTGEDVTKNIADIVRAEANNQLDSSRGFNTAYNTLRGGQAQSGTLLSGIGQQQQDQAVQTKTTNEARSAQGADAQTTAQNLFKTRTLQDIATSNDLAAKSADTQKKSAQVNVDRLIQDTLTETVQKENDTALAKQQAIESQVQPAAQTLFNQFTSQLRDPAAVAYADQLYGGSF